MSNVTMEMMDFVFSYSSALFMIYNDYTQLRPFCPFQADDVDAMKGLDFIFQRAGFVYNPSALNILKVYRIVPNQITEKYLVGVLAEEYF